MRRRRSIFASYCILFAGLFFFAVGVDAEPDETAGAKPDQATPTESVEAPPTEPADASDSEPVEVPPVESVETPGAEPVEAAVEVPEEKGTFFPLVRPGIDDSPSLPFEDNLPPAEERLKALFDKAGVRYPPAAIVLAAFKEERALDLFAKTRRGPWVFIHRYKIWAASGIAGPKLKEGDMQVPEGLYKVTWVRKKSSFHRALKLDYPNAFDRKMAATEKRTDLGGDIEIHGGSGSTGCLAMGDPSIEEIYELSRRVGRRRITVVIAPFDMRIEAEKSLPDEPTWTNVLYESIRAKLAELPPPPPDESIIEAKE